MDGVSVNVSSGSCEGNPPPCSTKTLPRTPKSSLQIKSAVSSLTYTTVVNILVRRTGCVVMWLTSLVRICTVVIVDPAIGSGDSGYEPYADGMKMDIFIKVLLSVAFIVDRSPVLFVNKLLTMQ